MPRFIATLFTLSICAFAARVSAEGVSKRVARAADSKAKSQPKEGDAALDRDASFMLLLESADTNGDARVSGAEFEALVQHHVRLQIRERFLRLDRNGDGSVTRAEVSKMDAARFARFDRNGDGGFTLSELALVMSHKATERCRVVLARLDADRDGALSAADRGQEFRVVRLEAQTASR
ncbi:MAG TPA: hypothetical protein VF989_08225 [Polyangiaceae bacterium]